MTIRGACVFALSLLSTSMVVQQSMLRGLAKDQDDKPLPEVLLEAVGDSSSNVFTTMSDPDGKYAVDPLPPGTYEIRVSKDGYTAYRQVGVVISERTITFLDLKLTPVGWEPPKVPKNKSKRRKPKRR